MKFRHRLLLKYADLSVARFTEVLRQWMGQQVYILLLSVFVGLLSGLAAVSLKNIATLWPFDTFSPLATEYSTVLDESP